MIAALMFNALVFNVLVYCAAALVGAGIGTVIRLVTR